MPLTRRARSLAVGIALAGGAALSCAPPPVPSPPPRTATYDYFSKPAPDDAWSAKIAGWQHRERNSERAAAAADSPASVSERGPGRDASPADLRAQFRAFRLEERRAEARRVASWVQEEARQHYIPDGPVDHWATLSETLARGGDDCDGLELLANHLLRDLGFSEDEVYRAIVYRPADGQHHMVTLWFEDRGDPWVIDPTGAMTSGMPHMSELRDWVPLKVFSDSREFTVRAVEVSAAR